MSANLTISEVAKLLNVTTVRVHGLIASKKLVVSETPKLVGNRYVTTITNDSYSRLIEERKTRSQTSGSRQYIVSLNENELDELKKLGYDLKPRFEKK